MRPIALLAVALALAVAAVACGDDDTAPAFKASQYAGTYQGTWTNPAAGTSGAASIVIKVDEKAKTASLTIDFDGNYLGLGDPPAATLTGTFDDKQAIAKGKSDLFGDYDVTIAADGKIVGLMEHLGGGAIPKMTYTGTLTADRMDADYVVTLPDGKVANSVLRLKKKS